MAIPSELPPPAGFTDLLAPTYDPSTGKTRSWVCVDAEGNVIIQAGGSGGTLQSATVVLTNAQLNNLAASPVQLVAGAVNTYLSIISAVVEFIPGSVVFSSLGSDLTIQQGNDFASPDGTHVDFTQAGLLNSPVKVVFDLVGQVTAGNSTSAAIGDGLFVGTTDTGPVLGTGNQLKVVVFYTVIPT